MSRLLLWIHRLVLLLASMSTFLLQIHSLQLLDEQQQSTQQWLPLPRQQHIFPSPTPSRLLIPNSSTIIICFGMCRWSRICLVNESSCLLTARLYGSLHMICLVLFLLPLLGSIQALPQRFWLGNNKISSSLALCCPLSQLMLSISWSIVQLLPVFGALSNMLLPPHQTLGSYNCMALFRIFDKVMILSLSTCNTLKICLMN